MAEPPTPTENTHSHTGASLGSEKGISHLILA